MKQNNKQYQQNNKSFDLISYNSKRKSKTMKINKKKEEISKEKYKKTLADAKTIPLRTNTFNKRQKLNQNKLYQRRSVTTTRGVDISPQVKNSIKSDIQRPTSSNGLENSKRNNWFKDYSKNENLLLSSNLLDLYESKKAFSFIANTKTTKKSVYNTQGKRNSSRRSNGYTKKSHSFSMTKKFKGLQKIFAKDPTSKLRHHNQTPNNQIGAMMSIPQTTSINNSSMIANKNILHHASWRRKPIKSSKIDSNQYYEQEKDRFWQWDLLANTSSSRGKRSSILDLSGIIPMPGNRTTLIKKSSINVPNFRSTSKKINSVWVIEQI